ncbi:Rrf2 family transcriptional regulator [Engelhardtia mirabilis]
MLQLTKRTEYGLIALVHLADRGGEFVSAREIGEHYPVPKRLLAEVLKDLGRAKLVESQRGATGGYTLSRPSESISLGEIIAAVEGRPTLTGCEALGSFQGGSCDVSPVCPIKSPIQRVRVGIWDLLQRTTLHDLAHPSPLALGALLDAREGGVGEGGISDGGISDGGRAMTTSNGSNTYKLDPGAAATARASRSRTNIAQAGRLPLGAES